MNFRIIFVLLFIPLFVFGEVSVLEQSDYAVSIEFNMEGLIEYPVTIGNKEYQFYRFEGGVVDETPGLPALPFINKSLAIPQKADLKYSVRVIESETRQGVDAAPQSLIYLRGEVRELPRDDSVYGGGIPFPEHIVEIKSPVNFRNVNIAKIRINPIQYFPADHTVKIIKRMRIDFSYRGDHSARGAKSLSQSEIKDLSHFILNSEQASRFTLPVPSGFRKQSVNYDFSTGQWYRIPIRQEGIYRITGDFLQSQGVDISALQISDIHLYNHGGFRLSYNVNDPRPSDLNEIAVQTVDNDQDGLLDGDDAIIFYGKGLGGWKFNDTVGIFNWEYQGFPYDVSNYYILSIAGFPGKRIQTVQSPQLSGAEQPATFTDFMHYSEDRYNILSSGLDWYWVKMTGLSDKKTVKFNLPNNIADGKTKLYFQLKGGSGSFYGDDDPYLYSLKSFINGNLVFENFTLSRNYASPKVVSNDNLFAITGGENELELNYQGNLQGCEAYLDYLEITFQRPFVAENGFLKFRRLIGNGVPAEYQITGMPGGTNVVWDISDFANIKRITPSQNGTTVRFQDVSQDPKAGEYFVFSTDVIRNVSSLEQIENHPNLRDPSRHAEYLIITSEEFYDQAEFLEDLRETQILNPLQVERVRVHDIYEEFSSSVQDVTAIRDFIKYVYENWGDTLKYVLLFGDGHYDYRNIQLQDYKNYVPPFEITNISEVDSRESDNFYVALGLTNSLNDIDPWLTIARIPVNNSEQIEVVSDKFDHYEKSYLNDPDRNGWQTWITLVADDQYGGIGQNNEWYHLQPTETLNKNFIPEKFNRTKIYLHDYDRIAGGLGRWKPKATEDLIDQINRGTLIINYFGHGDPDTWAHESVLNGSRDLPKLANDYRLPLWVAATCTWGKYDDPTRTSMSEELIWLPQRGAIGVISASRPVFVLSNVEFAKDFYNHLFHNKTENLHSRALGDAFFLAMQGQGSRNYQKFHLYGDPGLFLADPKYVVNIESVKPDTMKALSRVNVKASVTDQNGNLLSGFNGFAVLQAFDAVDSLYQPDANLTYLYNGGTIFKGLVSVQQGIIDGNFIVPKSIKYKAESTGRLSIYAWSDASGDAAGSLDTLMFYGSESQVDDPDGPEIDVSFKEMPNFFDGDFVNNQPTMVVELKDQNGINLTGEVGHRIELIIDENLKKDATEFFVYNTDSYQDGKLEYTLPALSTGSHQVKISCWDNLNNYSERTVAFRTSAANSLEISEIVNYPNPFSDETFFTFQLISPLGSAEVTVSIYTVTGRKIHEIKGFAEQGFNRIPSAGSGWNGRDLDGDLVANGVYLYKIVVDDGENRVEKIDKLAIVR